jgi:hypothetical protein
MMIGRAALIELRFTTRSYTDDSRGKLAIELIRLTMKFASQIDTLMRISAQ